MSGQAATQRTERTYADRMQILFLKLTTWGRCQCVFAVELPKSSACCSPVISVTARTVQILLETVCSAGRQLLEHFVYLWDFYCVQTFFLNKVDKMYVNCVSCESLSHKCSKSIKTDVIKYNNVFYNTCQTCNTTCAPPCATYHIRAAHHPMQQQLKYANLSSAYQVDALWLALPAP